MKQLDGGYLRKMLWGKVWLFAAIFIPIFYACLVSFKGLPPSEGWYQYWSYLMNEQGKMPYKDFQFLYPPLYMNFMALFAKVFGYNIISYRILGVFIFGIISFGLYLIFSLLFGKKIAFVCAVASALYMQSEPPQVFYDYVRVMDAISIFAVYFLLRSLKSNFQKKKCLFFNGLFVAFFVVIKQNSGIIFFAFNTVAIVFSMFYLKKTSTEFLKNLAIVLAPVVVVLLGTVIYLLGTGSMSYFLGSVSGDAAAAKGGLKVILFNWIIGGFDQFKGNAFKAVSLLEFWGIVMLCTKLFGKEQKEERRFSFGPYVFFFASVFFILLVFCFSEGFASKFKDKFQLSPYLFFDIIFPVFVIFLVYYFIKIFSKKNNVISFAYLIFAAAGSYFAISYGCGTSGGLVEGQAYLGVGLSVGITLWLIERFASNKKYMNYIKNVCSFCFIFMFTVFSLACANKKMFSLYQWWGQQEASYWESTEKTDITALLEGLRLSPKTKKFYEGIYNVIQSNTDKSDTIYCFPMIPFFYQILDRADPGVYAKVQWFDQCSVEEIKKDMAILKEKKPRAIVIFNVSEYAYEGHERLFSGGKGSITRLMKNFLLDFIKSESYTEYGEFSSDYNSVSVYIKDMPKN